MLPQFQNLSGLTEKGFVLIYMKSDWSGGSQLSNIHTVNLGIQTSSGVRLSIISEIFRVLWKRWKVIHRILFYVQGWKWPTFHWPEFSPTGSSRFKGAGAVCAYVQEQPRASSLLYPPTPEEESEAQWADLICTEWINCRTRTGTQCHITPPSLFPVVSWALGRSKTGLRVSEGQSITTRKNFST